MVKNLRFKILIGKPSPLSLSLLVYIPRQPNRGLEFICSKFLIRNSLITCMLLVQMIVKFIVFDWFFGL